jgi:hypothetical protein
MLKKTKENEKTNPISPSPGQKPMYRKKQQKKQNNMQLSTDNLLK